MSYGTHGFSSVSGVTGDSLTRRLMSHINSKLRPQSDRREACGNQLRSDASNETKDRFKMMRPGQAAILPAFRPIGHCVVLRRSNRSSVIISILLPLLFMFLLPSFRRNTSPSERPFHNETNMRPLITEALVRPPSYLLLGGDLTIVELILSVLRLPIDRWLFENVRCVTLISGVHGREISIKNDLQEEEQQTSHQTMALSPAEARLAYLSSGVPGHQSPSAYQRHYGPDAGGQSGDQGASGPNQPSYDYAGQPASAQEPAGAVEGPSGSLVPVEGQAESGGASSSLQARTDLPAVRALNVKCEKNHMTVSGCWRVNNASTVGQIWSKKRPSNLQILFQVNIVFDRPFYGLVFSKGHYSK